MEMKHTSELWADPSSRVANHRIGVRSDDADRTTRRLRIRPWGTRRLSDSTILESGIRDSRIRDP